MEASRRERSPKVAIAEPEKINWRRIAGDLAHTVMHTVKEHDYHQCSNWQEALERWKLAERHSLSNGKTIVR